MQRILVLLWVVGACDMLGPRVDDVTPDAAPAGPAHVRPAGAAVPAVTDSAELTSQIRIFDGLDDSALAAAGGVITRGTGKAGGATVRFWSFGAAPLIDGLVASALVYVLVDDLGGGAVAPRADHPMLLDGIPGDVRYSAIRRIVHVAVTASYRGERITSVAALEEAIALGLVGEPIAAGTWRNLPVVPTGTRLEVGGGVPPVAATEAYARGYRVEVVVLGGARGVQPLRFNAPPGGQEARLLSGVATGSPPALPTTPDPQPVFQFGIPAMAPTTAFNYTPIVTQLDVRLATGVDPAAIASDTQLFRRANGALTGFLSDSVASVAVTTTVTNKQLQFTEGQP